MITDVVAGLNWGMVLLAALVYFVLGALWFTPLFGRAWDRAIGHDRAETGGRFPLSYYVVPFISAAVATLVVAALLVPVGAEDAGDGAVIGGAVGIAVAAATVTNSLTPHTPKPYLFAAVTGGYHLVGLVVAGAILGGTT